MLTNILLPALQQVLLFLPLCLGMYLTYRILGITDLTVEGTFVLGAAVFARLVSLNIQLGIAIPLALLATGIIGLLVALIQYYAKLNSLITSILAIFMLYSVNFKIMGRPNIGLIDKINFLTTLQNTQPLLLWLIVLGLIAILILGICLLLHSRFGLLLRAFGDNPVVLHHLAKSRVVILSVGLIISNMFAGLSGVLTAQINGYADVNMGLGVALTAIGAMIIGLTFVNQCRRVNVSFHAFYDVLGVIGGVLIYFVAMNALLAAGLDPIYMKLVLGIILLVFLSSSRLTRSQPNTPSTL